MRTSLDASTVADAEQPPAEGAYEGEAPAEGAADGQQYDAAQTYYDKDMEVPPSQSGETQPPAADRRAAFTRWSASILGNRCRKASC